MSDLRLVTIARNTGNATAARAIAVLDARAAFRENCSLHPHGADNIPDADEWDYAIAVAHEINAQYGISLYVSRADNGVIHFV